MKIYEIREAKGIDSIQPAERPDPEPGHGEVLIRLKAASLNYRDLAVARGAYGRGVSSPVIPLSDGAGEVAATGPGVTRVATGDRRGRHLPPCKHGWPVRCRKNTASPLSEEAINGKSLAKYVVLNQDGVVKIPEHLTYEEAATLPCAAVTGLARPVVTAGKTDRRVRRISHTWHRLGVSIFALQFAKLLGARVIATSSSDTKLDRVREMGASDGINYKSTPDWEKPVRARTGVGVDHVVEVGGTPAPSKKSMKKAVRAGGAISLIGVLTGGTGEVNPRLLLVKNIRLQGIYVGSREMFEAMNRAIALHKLRPVVDRVFPFSDAVEAYRYLESGAHFGKVVIGF